jgi:hypothetical protein
MDTRIIEMLKIVWGKMPNWKLLNLDEDAVKKEVYKIYHGEDSPVPKATTSQSEYDKCVDRLKDVVEKNGGFYVKQSHDHVFVNPKQGDSSLNEWRVYLNIKAVNLAHVGAFIIENIFPLGLAEGFKVARDVEEADHFSDPLVIYLMGNEAKCDAVVSLLRTDAAIMGGLNSETPMMTKKTEDGIGIGESPKDYNVSFGGIRSAAIAKAVLSYWASERPASSVAENWAFFVWLTEQSFRLIGLNPDFGFCNGGSQLKKIDLQKFKSTSLLAAIMKRAVLLEQKSHSPAHQ